jgi:hypothetical protein
MTWAMLHSLKIIGMKYIVFFCLVKMRITQKDKVKFSMHYWRQNLNLSFFLSPKYNIFYSEKLHTNRIQYCLHHGIFSEFFERFEFEFLELPISSSKRTPLHAVAELQQSGPGCTNLPRRKKYFFSWATSTYIMKYAIVLGTYNSQQKNELG